MVRVGFLAPEGTFTHESTLMAAERHGWNDVEYRQYRTGLEALEAVKSGEIDYAVVADATSVGGDMTQMVQAIATAGLRRIDEIQRVCHYHLLALPGATLDGIKTVYAHAKARADCQGRLDTLVPGVSYIAPTSTAAGVRAVAESGRTDQAAIGTATAAALYGLAPLAENVEDDPDNWTRWVVVTR